jgi:hypothetical protein
MRESRMTTVEADHQAGTLAVANEVIGSIYFSKSL